MSLKATLGREIFFRILTKGCDDMGEVSNDSEPASSCLSKQHWEGTSFSRYFLRDVMTWVKTATIVSRALRVSQSNTEKGTLTGPVGVVHIFYIMGFSEHVQFHPEPNRQN